MPLILSLETSSTGCSVALHKGGQLLAISEIHLEHAHGAKLGLLIKEVLKNANVDFAGLSAIAIASGPGSYTGLRIGTSTAKGLCYALNIPLIAVDSLSSMAFGMRKTVAPDVLVCPMLDARRMEVYCAVFGSGLQIISPIQAKIIDEQSFADLLRSYSIIFFGNGAQKCKDKIAGSNALFVDDVFPSAANVGEMAHHKFIENKLEDLVHFEPLYLKEFLIKKPTKIETVLNK
jgi:tRNA threonylcarbamoyladenosine biosynthesis protein TsaB